MVTKTQKTHSFVQRYGWFDIAPFQRLQYDIRVRLVNIQIAV